MIEANKIADHVQIEVLCFLTARNSYLLGKFPSVQDIKAIHYVDFRFPSVN